MVLKLESLKAEKKIAPIIIGQKSTAVNLVANIAPKTIAINKIFFIDGDFQ